MKLLTEAETAKAVEKIKERLEMRNGGGAYGLVADLHRALGNEVVPPSTPAAERVRGELAKPD